MLYGRRLRRDDDYRQITICDAITLLYRRVCIIRYHADIKMVWAFRTKQLRHRNSIDLETAHRVCVCVCFVVVVVVIVDRLNTRVYILTHFLVHVTNDDDLMIMIILLSRLHLFFA